MEDYYNDGFNKGYGKGHLNDHHEKPISDQDQYSYDSGYEDGQRRKAVSDELDREMYGDD